MKRLFLLISVLTISSCSTQNSRDSVPSNYSSSSLSVESSADDGFIDFAWEFEEYDIRSSQTKPMNEYTEEDWNEHYKRYYGVIKDNNFVYYRRYAESNEYSILRCVSNDKDVTIPDTYRGQLVTGVALGAFCQCMNMETLRIGKNLRSLETSSFENCLSLKNVVIDPENENIVFQNNAIYLLQQGKQYLNYVLPIVEGDFAVSDDVYYIGSSAFNDAQEISAITLGAHFHEFTTYFPNCLSVLSNLQEIRVSDLNSSYSDIDGVLVNKEKDTLVKCPSGKNGEYVLPNGIQSIGPYAFNQCYQLEKITINGDVSFSPSQIANNNSVIEFELVNHPNYVSLNGNIYSKDLKTLYAVAPGKKEVLIENTVETISESAVTADLSFITIPDSVKTICSRAINSPNLKTVVLGSGVLTIEDYAFGYDYHQISINQLFYKGSVESLKNVQKTLKNIVLARAQRYYYSESKPGSFENHYWHYVNDLPVVW